MATKKPKAVIPEEIKLANAIPVGQMEVKDEVKAEVEPTVEPTVEPKVAPKGTVGMHGEMIVDH